MTLATKALIFPAVFQLSDIRGFVYKNGNYDVLLRNGMRVDATPEEVSKLKSDLKLATTSAVKKDTREFVCR